MKRALRTIWPLCMGIGLGYVGFACGEGLNVSVWYLDPVVGLRRTQTGQVMTFATAKGYYCVSPEDMSSILAEYEACKQAGK